VTILLYVLVFATAIPVGWLLAWLCKDELVDGRKWFMRIGYILVIILIVAVLVWRDVPIVLSLSYMIVVTAVSLYKSNDKKFVKSG